MILKKLLKYTNINGYTMCTQNQLLLAVIELWRDLKKEETPLIELNGVDGTLYGFITMPCKYLVDATVVWHGGAREHWFLKNSRWSGRKPILRKVV